MQASLPTPRSQTLLSLLSQPAHAVASIDGSPAHTALHGQVQFYQTRMGVLVCAELAGLPTADHPCEQPIFGFHIHSGSQCSNGTEPFSGAMGHYDPVGCPHPYHAGDLPPLFGANGRAFSVFLTNRFFLTDVLGKTIIVHAQPDDFTTQPSGNSGARIACGVIRPQAPLR